MSAIMELPSTKKCTKCGKVKGLGEFHKNKRERDGLAFDCKNCREAYAKKRAKDIKNRLFNYYLKFPEKTAESCKRQRENKRKSRNANGVARRARQKAMREFFKMHRAMHAIAETLNQMKP